MKAFVNEEQHVHIENNIVVSVIMVGMERRMEGNFHRLMASGVIRKKIKLVYRIARMWLRYD